ncbi:periplasmic solute-binding domain protein [Bacteriovorax sp. BSW11_IV]|uniref:metal ABC transporter solute-binding protein, Zn/Mn family n=1 Tax=Bacteriovorax sp. BSW11_IV TaxID=1353529 RepID=UPI00038A000C|nr:zinc ABC transporter substrate-binding protein [Bacteriovorax sp. BSW11_IV]EQC46434.1 periplasmic solute-binding domain protein [Bacteriovorax sp. BSW11_IV]
MRTLFILALLVPAFTLAKESQITCYHTQICNIVHYLAPKVSLEVLELPKETDPHHYEISAKELKTLVKAKHLITPNRALVPWIERALVSRKTEDSLELGLPKMNGQSDGPLAHFWLYKKGLCEAIDSIRNKLQSWQIPIENKNCSDLKIEELSKAQKRLLVVTHDALYPLASELGLEIVAARTSHHSHEVSAQTLKEIALKTKSRKSLWIVENQIKIPPTVLSYVKSDDKKVNLNTTGELYETPGQTLKSLLKEIFSDN